MQELAAVLKPLKLVTELLSSDSYPTMSFVYLTLKGLISKHLQTESVDTFMIKPSKNYWRKKFNSTSGTKHNENL